MQYRIFKTLSTRVCCLLIWLLFAIPLTAQEYLVQVNHYGIEDGLSHRDVHCVYQDRQNLIWLGTKYGLNRFDGLNFKWYTKETMGLQSNDITNILEGVDNQMWLISTEHHSFGAIKSIDIFDPIRERTEPFEKVFGKAAPFVPSDVLSFCQSSDGQILLLTKYSELIVYDGRFKAIPLCIEIAEKGMTLNSSPAGLILLVINIPNTGTEHSGGSTTLLVFNQNGEEVRRFKHDDYDFSDIIDLDKLGNCQYVVSQQGKENQFFHITPDGRQLNDTATAQLFTKNRLNSRPWDYYNNVLRHNNFWWASTGDNTNGAAFMGFPEDPTKMLVSGNSFDDISFVNDIFNDRSGRLWLCTQFGLYLITLKPNHFSKLLFNESDERIATRNMVIDDAGNFWVVQDNLFNLWKIDRNSGKTALVNRSDTDQDKLPIGNYFVALFKDSKGYLYYQSEHYLIKFNPATLNYEQIELTEPDPKWKFYRVWAIYEDEFGKIWFSIDSGEIGYWDGNKAVMFPPLDKLNGAVSFAYQFFKDRSGKTWLVTDGGLYVLDVQSGKTLSHYCRVVKTSFTFPLITY